MKFGPREIVFILLLTVIPIAAWWFVFRPQNARNTDMIRQIEAKQAKLRQLNSTIANIGDLQAQIHKLNKAIDYFGSKLPNEKEMDKVLQEIWLLAKANNLNPKAIRTLNRRTGIAFTQPGGETAEQPIRVKLEGNFMGFYAFLLALENQPRITRIRQMQLQATRNGPQGCVSAEFEMSIFFERNKKESPWEHKTTG